ncbi:MAG: Uma2 family endonuclease [Microscillaceae bacterium]|nr:Uma2 family endonuclease [Microscillaceae bacterium]
MGSPVRNRIPIEDYFIHEKDAFIKSEYHNGEIIAMGGTTTKHDLMVNHLIAQLLYCLKKKGYKLFSKDVLVHAPACNRVFYPDIFIVCGKILKEKRPWGASAVLNPSIVVEVLSESTQEFDRTEKFDCYKTIAEFRKYFLVYQHELKVEVHEKISPNQWLETTLSQENDVLDFDACEVILKDLYDLDLEEDEV